MRLKARPGDFRVVERLDPSFLGEGPFTVYQVVKRKWTTLEVASLLAREAGVERSAISYAGMKDRQAVAVQHFAVEGGRRVTLDRPDLKVRPIGASPRALSPQASRGNSFEIVVRGLDRDERERLRANLEEFRRVGVPNYFDDQRFGNLRHGQGWVARRWIEGRFEEALRDLIVAPSPFDDPHERGFKAALRRSWGNWSRCARIARGRRHESLFRHLAENPGDFRGALRFVAQRIRVLHAFAYQSHLWNRSVGAYLREVVPFEDRVYLKSDEGPLLSPRRMPPGWEGRIRSETFPLLAPDTREEDDAKRRAIEETLRAEGLALEDLRVQGEPGFVFRTEGRPLFLHPEHLRLRPAERDETSRGRAKVLARFDLPRGGYATLVLKRLFAPLAKVPGRRVDGERLRVSGASPFERPRDGGRFGTTASRYRGRPRRRGRT